MLFPILRRSARSAAKPRAGRFFRVSGWALGLALLCAGCGALRSPQPPLPSPGAADAPSALERGLWRELNPQQPTSTPDEGLRPLALRLLALCGRAPAQCAGAVEGQALALGLLERPLAARYFLRAAYPSEAAFRGALAEQLKTQRSAGFQHFTLVAATAETHLASVLWLASRRDILLDEPPPTQLAVGQVISLGGSLGDDAGLLHWVWRTPQGAVLEENWPYFGGRFSRRLSLNTPGLYALDIARAEISGQRRLLGRRWFWVRESPAETAPADAAPSLTPALVRAHLEAGRAAAKAGSLADLKEAEKDFESGLRAEALRTPLALAEVSRPLILSAYPYLDCRLFSLYGDGTSALDLLDAPAASAVWQSAQTQAARIWVVPQGAGQRILLAACRFYSPAQSALYDWTTAEGRRQWHARREQKLAQLFGIVALDPLPLVRAQVQLGEILPLLALLWDNRADLPGLVAAPLAAPFRTRAQPVGDELFVTLYETREALRAAWPANDARLPALTRYLCSALLFAGRVEDCRSEALRLDAGANDALALARAAELGAQAAAYESRREEALQQILIAMNHYQTLGWFSALERLGLESALLLEPAQARVPAPTPRPERAPAELPTPPPDFLDKPAEP